MNSCLSSAGCIGVFIASCSFSALTSADVIGYTVTIGPENLNPGRFTLRNDSAEAQIVEFEFTIGDTRFFFDSVARFNMLADSGSPLDASVVLPSPNVQGDLLRSTDDLYRLSLVGFDPADELQFSANVDVDGTNVSVGEFVYFDNGLAPNSTVTVTFSNGDKLSFPFPENPTVLNHTVTISQSGSMAQNPVNGHLYQLVEVTGGINWIEARDAAGSASYNGLEAHLATVTSPEEADFLANSFPQIFPEHVWLGATDAEEEGNWLWITGEPWSYSSWNPVSGEPNGGPFENCLDYSASSDKWNDDICDRKINFYLVEYEGQLGVAIDIKPGKQKNVINVRSKGDIWVAIPSATSPQAAFDPLSQVDISTVEFGPHGAKAIRHRVKDKNKDGLADLLLRFKIPATGIACGDSQAILSGKTFDGKSFFGADAIETVGCKKPKKSKKKKQKEEDDDEDEDDD